MLDQLNPYALLTGATTVSVFAMHGGIYLHLKTEGEFQARLERVIWSCFGLFLTLFLIQTMWTLVEVPRATANFRASKWLWVVPMANVLAVANIPRSLFRKKPAAAFLSSSFNIFAYVFLLMTALWPDIVVATDPARSLSLSDAASSDKTLIIGLIVVAIGMPFVVAYSAVVYWTFRGRCGWSRIATEPNCRSGFPARRDLRRYRQTSWWNDLSALLNTTRVRCCSPHRRFPFQAIQAEIFPQFNGIPDFPQIS